MHIQNKSLPLMIFFYFILLLRGGGGEGRGSLPYSLHKRTHHNGSPRTCHHRFDTKLSHFYQIQIFLKLKKMYLKIEGVFAFSTNYIAWLIVHFPLMDHQYRIATRTRIIQASLCKIQGLFKAF